MFLHHLVKFGDSCQVHNFILFDQKLIITHKLLNLTRRKGEMEGFASFF